MDMKVKGSDLTILHSVFASLLNIVVKIYQQIVNHMFDDVHDI